jgi:hypothetical protein
MRWELCLGVRALAAGGPMGEAVILVDDVAQKQ